MKYPLIVIRHGSTALNESDGAADRIRGWHDVPLSQGGFEEANKLAAKLKGSGIQVIFTSDLVRAVATANIVGNALGIKPILSKNLRPWNLGHLTGKPSVDCLPIIRQHVMHPNVAVPQGESFNQFKERALRGVGECIAANLNQRLAIVTHHRVERLLKAWDAKGQPPNHSIDIPTLLQKGEAPGNAETINIDLGALMGNGTAPNLSQRPSAQAGMGAAEPGTPQ